MKKETNNSLILTTKNIKLKKILCNTVIIIVAIITLIIGIYSTIKTSYFNTVINFASELSFLKYDNIFLNILYVSITIGVFYFLYKKIIPKISIKVLFILMIVFSLSIGFWWVNYIKFKPISDQSMIVYCAEKLLDKEPLTILNPGEYLNRNPHQLRIYCLRNDCIQNIWH